MPNTALVQKKSVTTITDLKSYAILKSRVKKRLALGRERAEAELVRTYWDVGHMINTHIQVHKGRAEYGKEVIKKLAGDIGTDPTVLWCIAKFPKVFPILVPGQVLPWSHYRALLAVDDDKRRTALAARAYKEGWSKEELRARIRRIVFPKPIGRITGSKIPLKTPLLGQFYTYRIFQPKSVDANVKMPLKVDLGFQVYIDLALLRFPKGLKEGDIVRAKPGSTSAITKAGTVADLFTYRAMVEDVTDGDTLRVHIDLGLGASSRQYLRLTHINGPELKTKEGQAAREFVLREILRSPIVKLRSTKHDLFDRYLADIFLEDGTYLNQRILDAGHAVRMEMS